MGTELPADTRELTKLTQQGLKVLGKGTAILLFLVSLFLFLPRFFVNCMLC